MKTKINFTLFGLFTLLIGAIYANSGNAMDDQTNTTSTTLAELQKDKPKKQYVKIALLLDTSNSMDGLINQAKSQLWDIVNEFSYAKCANESRPELQIALYEYGNDDLASTEGYMRQVLNFSGDLDLISEKLFSLSTNGGEEYCGEVIHKSLEQLQWGKNEDDLKLIFIAGNEPFTQGKLNYKDAATQAKEKNVVVNTIFCGAYEQGIRSSWKDGATLTGGEYMAIDQNKKIVHIETPYDEVIIKLNHKLNNTYIQYGSLGAKKYEAQSAQDAEAAYVAKEVAVKRAVSKSSRLYNNASWDLVDAYDKDQIALSDLKPSQLPEVLKNKTEKEIEAYITLKKAERAQIQQAIQKQNAKRQKFIEEHTKEEDGKLENAMLSAIKKQAATKDFKW
ncbi:Von Willebrand factor type A [Croceitalea dokdonensis DOKDO 023]|uniref:von Willebrand factor type A n=1 Tax=Croceitalea dokdonensis DOKDO 023 TaxID=1300341 RepID=A0A0P7B0G1_9FLAO|nr:vWA domain-containing protein [Croceitalea dokdonensis]KPM31382.1 Von Willebrand factor type A [Croceitalea dokdonensis DOKDO 023]